MSSDSGNPKDIKYWSSILMWIIGGFLAFTSAGSVFVLGWMFTEVVNIREKSVMVPELKERVDDMIGIKAQMEILALQQRDVISPVVERSLSELRHKTNEQYEASAISTQKLLDVANQNRSDIRDVQKDIAQIKELLKKP